MEEVTSRLELKFGAALSPAQREDEIIVFRGSVGNNSATTFSASGSAEEDM